MNLPASEQDITRISKYLQMTKEYARECKNMVDTLGKLKKLQIGDNKMIDKLLGQPHHSTKLADEIIDKLLGQAHHSTKLADEISELLTLGKNTYPTIRNDNLVRAMTSFVTLSESYMKMREGFDELLTAPESYIASHIAKKGGIPHENIEKLSKNEKQDLVMSYMREQKKPEPPGGRQWSNQEIGSFFNMKANTVVNRLTKFNRNRKGRGE